MKDKYVKPSMSAVSADLCSILSASGEQTNLCSSFCKLWHICRDREHGKVGGDFRY